MTAVPTRWGCPSCGGDQLVLRRRVVEEEVAVVLTGQFGDVAELVDPTRPPRRVETVERLGCGDCSRALPAAEPRGRTWWA